MYTKDVGMASIEEVQILLDEIAEELPPEIYKDLNGGIILLPQAKQHTKSMDDDLYVMGEYRYERISGRYIVIYYGSVNKIYGDISRDKLKKKLRKIVKHEFVHHLESLAGERDLEIEDKKQIERYIRGKNKEN